MLKADFIGREMVKWRERPWSLCGEMRMLLFWSRAKLRAVKAVREKSSPHGPGNAREQGPAHMSSGHGGGVSAAEATDHEDRTQLLLPGSVSCLIIKCKSKK